MTDNQILKAAIEKAKNNGWSRNVHWDDHFDQPYADNNIGGFSPMSVNDVIFDHGFMKALCGDDLLYAREIDDDSETIYVDVKHFEYHLQRIALEPTESRRIQYLKQFVENK